MDTELAFSAPSHGCEASSSSADAVGLSPSEAARRLGVSRSRIYALVEQGALDDVGQDRLRVSLPSLQRRLAAVPPVGQPLSPSSAWAVLALASDDAAFRAHVAARLSDPERSRAKARLEKYSLLELLPRLRARATPPCGFSVRAEPLVDLLADARLILGGSSAARLLDWPVPAGTWPLEAYVVESQLAALVDQYALERDEHAPDVVLRTVQEPWPFPPQARMVPAAVAAVDLAEAADGRLVELGRGQLDYLARDVITDWRQRPRRRPVLRPLVPTTAAALEVRRGRHAAGDDLVWDDRAEQDANQLVALLFVAATPLRRGDVAEKLRVSHGRLARACALLKTDPPRGLRLEEAGDQLGLVSAPDCAAVIERHLGQPAPEPLSEAALHALAIVAYEQPVTRADIRAIRGIDSDAVVETLRARGLVAEDPRFGGRGRPGFLITTPAFLRSFGLNSLNDLPPRPSSMLS